MSPLFEHILVLVVMSVLVALFTWIYFRDRQREFGLWLLGWSAIFIHFANPVVSHWLPLPQGLTEWIHAVTLLVAGTFFLLSVSEVSRNKHQPAIFIFMIGAASVVYLTGLVLHFRPRWVYLALLSASIISGLFLGILFYGLRNLYLYGMATMLLPYSLWAIWQAGKGNPDQGLVFYLFGFFSTAGVAYFRRFRRFTPGVVFTSAAFMAWGLVFPVSTFLDAHKVSSPDFVWDLPH